MLYKIEQLDNDTYTWLEVGETMSLACAYDVCRDLKNENKKVLFRIIRVLDII